VNNGVFFANAEGFRRWLAAHAATASELLVGFMKRHTDATSMTWLRNEKCSR
jgi:hypothetical protein